MTRTIMLTNEEHALLVDAVSTAIEHREDPEYGSLADRRVADEYRALLAKARSTRKDEPVRTDTAVHDLGTALRLRGH